MAIPQGQDIDLAFGARIMRAALPQDKFDLVPEFYVDASQFPIVDHGSVSGAVVFDLLYMAYHRLTLTGAATFSITNGPITGQFANFKLAVTNAGAYSITYPSSWTFRSADGTSWSSTPPSGHILASGVTEFDLLIDDGGTTVRVIV